MTKTKVMDWRAAYKKGRAPSMIQMRLLQTIWVPTRGPQVEYFYKQAYGYDVAQHTIYGTIGTMHKRGWVDKEWSTDEHGYNVRVYSLTALGIRVLSTEIVKFQTIATAKPRSGRKFKVVG